MFIFTNVRFLFCVRMSWISLDSYGRYCPIYYASTFLTGLLIKPYNYHMLYICSTNPTPTEGYALMQYVMAYHENDPLCMQYTSSSMVKIWQAAGLDLSGANPAALGKMPMSSTVG